MRVADRGGLERGVRVPIGVARVAEATEAHVDHAGAVRNRPVDRLHLRLDVDQVVAVHDLGDEELGGGRHACDPDRVVDARGDQPGDEGAVALLVDAGGAADEALRVGDLALELGVRRVDARVDDRNAHGRQRRQQHRGFPEVEGAVGRQVPLLQRIVRNPGGAAAHTEPLHVGRAR